MTCDCYCTNHAQKQVPPIIYQLIFEIWEKQLIIHKQCQTIHEQNHATEGKNTWVFTSMDHLQGIRFLQLQQHWLMCIFCGPEKLLPN